MGQHNEVVFETEICEHLQANGWWYSPNDAGHDKDRALFPEDVLAWLGQTQPEELAKILKPGMSPQATEKATGQLLDRLVKVLGAPQPSGGTLHVLRAGFKHQTASFQMMQQRPRTSQNQKLLQWYSANRVRVMRQLHYSRKHPLNSIDLVLFINGLPVATAELKTDFTQSVDDAKRQYMKDRNPQGEPLLGCGSRALVHFAVSNDEVWMTTRLAGPQTRFLPFNRGWDGHAGNPPSRPGGVSPTSYLWEEVWQRDRWLEVVGKYMHFEKVESMDETTGRKHVDHVLIFPRYHQLDAVSKLVGDVEANGPGKRYLIQHSAGSGKTRTIAWTAHRLATLHDAADQRVFDSVIVVTDRNVLDAQLQDAVKQIESKSGMVATITTREANKLSLTSKSQYLAHTLTAGRLIIVVTIQTFPHVLKALQEDQVLQERRFAVIADEAHSSQTGVASEKLKEVLSAEEVADLEDGGDVDVEAILAATMKAKADTPNISFFAFTATPKQKTLEMFGTPDPDDLDDRGEARPRPFHLYTMQQAIEENFILDVLRNYTTYKTAFRVQQQVDAGAMRPLLTTDANGNLVDEAAATKGVLRWVRLHPTNIAQKVAFIMDHFDTQVKHVLDGRAKAMVVADSRKSAVRYKLALDEYIARHNLTEVTALVAFSGSVVFDANDPVPPSLTETYSEATMNPGVRDLRTAFNEPEYRVMIVANKFQTGFDQPLLCAMYVDKRLSGVTAVQTLSRLNRFKPGKRTFVVDFVNSEEDILAAFRPYYREATIAATTDPNLIHDLQAKLDMSGRYEQTDVDAVVSAWVTDQGNNALAAALSPVKKAFIADWVAALQREDHHTLDELALFRKDVGTFVRLYDFLSQVINFGDTEIEKRAIFFRLLERQIRATSGSEQVDLTNLDLDYIAQRKKFEGTIDLAGTADDESDARIPGMTATGQGQVRELHMVLLEEVLEKLNDLFRDLDIDEKNERGWVEGVLSTILADHNLVNQAVANNEDQFLHSPDLRDAVLDAMESNADAAKRVIDFVYTDQRAEIQIVEAIGRLVYMEARQPAGVGGVGSSRAR